MKETLRGKERLSARERNEYTPAKREGAVEVGKGEREKLNLGQEGSQMFASLCSHYKLWRFSTFRY